jgi:hypothetical protein
MTSEARAEARPEALDEARHEALDGALPLPPHLPLVPPGARPGASDGARPDAQDDALERDRRRRDSVATADRVFAALLGEVEGLRDRRTVALRLLGPPRGGPHGRAPDAGRAVGEDPLAAPRDQSGGGQDPLAAPRDESGGGGQVPVTLAGRPGASATASLWVHNIGAVPVSALALRLTALTAEDGATLAGSHGTLHPARVDVDPEASAEVHVTVAVPAGAAPGVYAGHVRGQGLPGTSAVPVRLVVDP